MSLLQIKTLMPFMAMPISITLPQKHGQTSPPLQALPSPPLLSLLPSASPSPSTTPMPSSVPLEHPPSEETPISTALMAQTPLPPPALPPAPLLHHGVPSLNQQTNQSPPLLMTLSSATPSPSTTPMPLSVLMAYHQAKETPISTALMAQTPSPQTAPPLAPPLPLLLHHGVPSPTLQTNQSLPLLVAPTSADPSPSTTPMPSSVPLEYHQTKEKPTSTALMAQMPLPPPAPPLAPPPPLLLHHGVPFLNHQTNQSPPFLVALTLASPSPSMTPMPSSVPMEHPQAEETPSSTALMAQMPLPQTVLPPTPPLPLLLHHGVPFLNHQTNQSLPLLVTPTLASPSPSTTPMPLLVPLEYHQTKETPSYIV